MSPRPMTEAEAALDARLTEREELLERVARAEEVAVLLQRLAHLRSEVCGVPFQDEIDATVDDLMDAASAVWECDEDHPGAVPFWKDSE